VTTSFITPSCEVIDQCEYTLILTDTYGDGWSGGHLYVRQNGVQIADLAAVDHVGQHGVMSYDTVPLMLCHGANVELVWDNGNMFNECGFIFQNPEGVTLYQIDQLFNYYPDTVLYAFTANCPVIEPTVVTDSVSQIGQNSATLYGHLADLGNQIVVNQGFEWKTLSGSTYMSVNIATSPMVYTVTGLQHSTEYVFRAFAATDTAVYYGQEITFTTEPGPCPAPTDLHVTDSSSQTISIAWTENGDAEQWNIQYRSTATGVMSSGVSSSPAYLITDLDPNTEYQIQVKSVCGPVTSDWTPVVIGKTTNTGVADYDRYIKIYPNPANDVVHVECTMDNAQWGGEIQIVDVYGKVVAIVETRLIASLQTRIDVSGLAAGVYFVRIATDRGFVTKPFVKQ
jgi:hypothetical protein